jgi:hypothetical protein
MGDRLNRPIGEQLSSLQARAAALGLVIHPLRSGQAPAYVVARTSASREFSELNSASRFIDEWAGGCDAR